MWRWVTRGLVLAFLLASLSPSLIAQTPGGVIGQLELPDPNVTQGGVVLVRGWVFDPAQISRIELYVDDQFQYPVVMNLPRIDVAEAYPNYPGLHTSFEPGFQVGFLASRFSNGPHTVYVKVYFSNGNTDILGSRTINIDNTLKQPPFGSIDQPDQSGTVSMQGSYPMVGWAAAADGVAQVNVYIDGGNLQSAMYGDMRPDVGQSFPDFPGATYSGWIANIDTTRVQDGVHLVEVKVTAKNGVTRLLGTRNVQILNSQDLLKPFGVIDYPEKDAVLYGTQCGATAGPPIISPPVRPSVHIEMVRGWALDLGTRLDTGRVSYAELMIDGVRWLSTDDCTLPFGGYANCYGVPRYDVERFYPNYPDAPRAGFIFTLDVGNLLNLGLTEGNHQIKVRVGDLAKNVTELPGPEGLNVFFKCADSSFDSPSFGFIDIPSSFDYIGGNIVFQGWALDFDGIAAVEMIIDGNYVGQAQYGYPRPDVADQNPNFIDALHSGWQFTMDTRKLSNARHRLTARVLDDRGNRDEIGSVDFYVYNTAQPTP